MVAPAQVCEFAFLFMELCSVPINLFLQPLLAPLSGDTPTWYTSSPPSFSSLPWVHSDPSYGSVMKSFKKLGPVSTSWFHHCWPVFNCNTWHFLQAFTLVSSVSFKFILLSQISSDYLWKFLGKNCKLAQHNLPSMVSAFSYFIKLGNNISTKPNWLWKGECSPTSKQTPEDRKVRIQYVLRKR